MTDVTRSVTRVVGIFPTGAVRRRTPCYNFVLFLKEKNGGSLTYQLFIEPKGGHLAEKDRWKEEFLKEIKREFGNRVLRLEESKYRLIGVPFYNNADENIFRQNLGSALMQQTVDGEGIRG